MADDSTQIREIAGKWLSEGAVEAVIGWGTGTHMNRTAPILVRKADDIDKLVFNENCINNLSAYFRRDQVKKMKCVGIVAKGCDIKSIIGLIQESQITREQVKILAVACAGVISRNGSIPVKCQVCEVNTPTFYDEIVGEKIESKPKSDLRYKEVEELESKSSSEKIKFWKDQFSNCIRCYACRQSCPLCICNRCIADKNQPQWIETSIHTRANFSWNLVRAYHLAGRCIECEACEEACPVNIPLMLLNRKMAKEVKSAFDYSAGENVEDSPPLRTFKLDDDNSFIG